MVDENACGLVLYPSWWSNYSSEDAVAFVRSLVTRSSLCFCKLDSTGLGSSEVAVAEALQELRSADPTTDQVIQLASGHTTSESDAIRFEQARSLGRSITQTSAVVGGLSETDRELLALGVLLADARNRGVSPGAIEQVRIQVIAEGQSGCSVYQVSADSTDALYIAKVHTAAEIVSEFRRARLIAAHLGDYSFHCYCHRGRGVLLQRMVGRVDEAFRSPAPSLAQRVADAHHHERGRTRVMLPELGKLQAGLDRLIASVRTINETEAAAGVEMSCWLTVEPLEHLAGVGAEYSIESAADSFEPRGILDWVQARIDTRKGERMVHGDLHAGNVLLVADDFPVVIDFGLSGSGHPAFDLVRLSAALTYPVLRPTVPEPDIRRFFEDVFVAGCTHTEITVSHSKLLAGVSPTFAGYSICACRDAAIDLLGGDEDAKIDLLAMTYLVAAQHLSQDGAETAVVRATLGALHPEISKLVEP